MSMIRLLVMALLAGVLAVSACGKKGDPTRPGEKPEQKSTY